MCDEATDKECKVTLCAALLLGLSSVALAGDGYVVTDFNNDGDGVSQGAVMLDGRIVSFGTARAVSVNNLALAATRHEFDGTPDLSFGTDGRAVVPNSRDLTDACNAGSLDLSGRVLLGGMRWNYRSSTWVIARLKVDGTLDKTFNKSGVVTPVIYSKPLKEEVTGIGVQADGKIVAVGISQLSISRYPFRAALVRYKDNGTLDTAFGSSGIAKPVLNGSEADSWQLSGLTFQKDGKIVACGYASEWDLKTVSLLVMRFNSNGSLDPSFGGDGVVTLLTDASLQRRGFDVEVQPSDDKILVGFEALDIDPVTSLEARYPGVARFNSNGWPRRELWRRRDSQRGLPQSRYSGRCHLGILGWTRVGRRQDCFGGVGKRREHRPGRRSLGSLPG